KALRSRLRPLRAPREVPRPAAGGWRSWSWARARLAAGLILAVLGFAFGWTAARFKTHPELRVHPDVQTVNLFSDDEISRGSSPVETIRTDLDATLILNLPGAAEEKEYEAHIE